jgi:hypothetical protein
MGWHDLRVRRKEGGRVAGGRHCLGPDAGWRRVRAVRPTKWGPRPIEPTPR